MVVCPSSALWLGRSLRCDQCPVWSTCMLGIMVARSPSDDLVLCLTNTINLGVTMYEDAEIEQAIKRGLQWLVNQLDRATEAKKDSMRRKKPGSVVSHQPRFVWLKMINRVNGNGKSNILSFRPAFNADLEAILAEKMSEHLIADLSQVMMDTSLFDRHNNLNAFGRVKFWEELDHLIEKYDKRAVHLKPVRKASNSDVSIQVNQARHRQQGTRCFFMQGRGRWAANWRNFQGKQGLQACKSKGQYYWVGSTM